MPSKEAGAIERLWMVLQGVPVAGTCRRNLDSQVDNATIAHIYANCCIFYAQSATASMPGIPPRHLPKLTKGKIDR